MEHDPNIDHIKSDDFHHVYEPAEDSYLMMDALKLDEKLLWEIASNAQGKVQSKKQPTSMPADTGSYMPDLTALSLHEPPLCVEVGCGTGVLSAYLARLLVALKQSVATMDQRDEKKTDAGTLDLSKAGGGLEQTQSAAATPPTAPEPVGYFVATDINPKAVELATRTFERNGVRGQVVETDLLSGLAERLQLKVDVLLFNPPYVPTDPEEMKKPGIYKAWAGGRRGREVLDRLLPLLSFVMKPGGLVYLVVLRENDPEELKTIMNKNGFDAKVINSRKTGREFLSIIRYQKRVPTWTQDAAGPASAADHS